MSLKYLIFGLCLFISEIQAWGSSSNPGKVLLRDVQVLTLRQGQMTTGRRSSPVPQLNCVGGSAQGPDKAASGGKELDAIQLVNPGLGDQIAQVKRRAGAA